MMNKIQEAYHKGYRKGHKDGQESVLEIMKFAIKLDNTPYCEEGCTVDVFELLTDKLIEIRDSRNSKKYCKKCGWKRKDTHCFGDKGFCPKCKDLTEFIEKKKGDVK